MRFVFWQNVISIHQSAFIKALADRHSVTLVVEEAIAESRRKEGWAVPDMGNATIVISPSQDKIEALLADSDAFQVFSGIDAFPLPAKAFRMAVRRECEISVMMEPFDPRGWRGCLRHVKYSFLAARYNKHIRRLFTTGRDGERQFRKAGFHNIYQWGYFVEYNPVAKRETDIKASDRPKSGLPIGLYIGQINSRKNILPLVNWLSSHADKFESFTIIGNGPQVEQLKSIISKAPNIRYLGTVSNSLIQPYIVNSDFLVIPSLHDGWAAVINEALLCGTRVVCSNRCGGSVLIDEANTRGAVFNPDTLAKALSDELARPRLSDDERDNIKQWAIKNISGEAASLYFASCFTDKPEKPIVPWLQ